MTGNNYFVPSKIEDEIYEIMDDYILGSDIYEYGLCDAIEDYFINEVHKVYQMCCSPASACGGVCSVAWVEGAYPKLVVFEYRKEVE